MQYKTFLAFTSVVVLGATLLAPSGSVAKAHPLALASNGGGAAIDDEVAGAITEATNIVGFFRDIDVDIDSIPVMPAAYDDVLAEIIDILLDDIDPADESQYAEENSANEYSACSDVGAQIAHGRTQAINNINRGDAQATNLNDETAYMFLSHYVDVWNATGCAASATLYADWLTNSDRIAYDAFQNSIGMVDAGTKIFDIITNASNAVSGSSATVSRILDPSNWVSKALKGGPAVYLGYNGIKQDVENVTDAANALITEGHSAEYIATKIKDIVNPKFNRINPGAAFAGVVLALMSGNIAGVILSIGVYGLAFVVTGVQGLAQKAAVNTMAYTRSGRVAARFWRYLGLG